MEFGELSNFSPPAFSLLSVSTSSALPLSTSFAEDDLGLGCAALPASGFAPPQQPSPGIGISNEVLKSISSPNPWNNNDVLEYKHMTMCNPDENEFEGRPHRLRLEDVGLDCNWEDVTCPICLDFPHNGVLLQCSSYDKGCRPFMCDTDQAHSNCLERFKSAYGMPIVVKVTSTTDGLSMVCIQDISSNSSSRPACPLCRGDVNGWVVIDEARVHLNMKKRCCEEKQCSYVGNFSELQKHAQLKHPDSCPSEIDPARQLDWDNFQQSSEIIDVLSTIHAEVPHGVVLGDYVIEYGDAETGDEPEDFPRSRGNWLTSCISCKVFHRGSRSRQRSRGSGRRRSSRHSSSDGSNLGEGSTRSVDIREYRFVETDEELARTGNGGATESIVIPNHYRYGSQRSHFPDH